MPGPDPTIGVSVALAYSAMENWEQVYQKDGWQGLMPIEISNLSSPFGSTVILSNISKTCRRIMGFQTDHNSLTQHMFGGLVVLVVSLA